MPLALSQACPTLPSIRRSQATCVGVALALTVAGCATDRQQTQGEGAAAGALLGALAGRVIGGKGSGTVVGAVVGAAAGTAVGTHVADTKAAYIQREDAMQASADHARKLTAQLRASNDMLGRNIAALDASIQRQRQANLGARAQRDLALANRQSMVALVGQVDRQLDAVHLELSQQQAVAQAEEQRMKEAQQKAPDPALRQVSAGIHDLQGQEQALQQARLQLQQLDQRRAY